MEQPRRKRWAFNCYYVFKFNYIQYFPYFLKKKNLYLLNAPVNETKAITMNFKFNANVEKPVINLLHFWNKEDWKKYCELKNNFYKIRL